MSSARATPPDTSRAYDPWSDLGRRAGVTLMQHQQGEHARFPTAWGLTTFSSLTISVRTGLTSAQARATLAHELAHLERGPVLPGGSAGEERAVREIAAKRLINPSIFEALVAVHPNPASATIEAVCNVDDSTFGDYGEWRSSVTAQAARQVWAESCEPAAWPPAWLSSSFGRQYMTARSETRLR